MNVGVGLAVGGTVGSASVLLAESITSGEGVYQTGAIWAIGAGVVAWLVRREGQEREAAREREELNNQQRREADQRAQEEHAATLLELRRERELNRDLYERLVAVSLRVNVPIPDVELSE